MSFAEEDTSARQRRAAKSNADALTASTLIFTSVMTSIPECSSLQNHAASSYLMYGAAMTTDLLAAEAIPARSFRQDRLRSWIIPSEASPQTDEHVAACCCLKLDSFVNFVAAQGI